MAVDDVFRLIVTQTQFGSFYQNSYAFRIIKEPAITVAEATTLATDFKEMMRTQQSTGLVYRGWKLVQVYGSGVVYDPVECKRSGGRVLEGTYTTNLAGTDAIDANAPQLAMTLTLYSDQIGRRKRGRVYIGGWTENAQSGGNFTSTVLTAVTTSMGSVLAKYGSNPSGTDTTFRLGIWSERTAIGCEPGATHPHPPTRVDPPHPELAFTPIDRWLPRQIVYTQRRRTLGVGR